jgi:serine protease Do
MDKRDQLARRDLHDKLSRADISEREPADEQGNPSLSDLETFDQKRTASKSASTRDVQSESDDEWFEEGREFTEEELAQFFAEADEEEPASRPFFASPFVRKLVVAVVALVMLVQAMAWLPSIYSLDAIQFLKVSAELSQSAEIQHFKKSVALIRTKDGKGTGFVVDSAGWVITNRHVVGDDPNPVVSVNGKRYVAQVAAISDEVDLALLSIDAQGLPELSLADHYDGEAGVPFYVIGNPLFFTGIANAGETLGLIGSSNVPMMALRAPIYRGNSGSPIITEAGEVIGVVYAMSSIQVNGSKMKIGLAVPIQWVHLLLEEAGAWSAGEETTG